MVITRGVNVKISNKSIAITFCIGMLMMLACVPIFGPMVFMKQEFLLLNIIFGVFAVSGIIVPMVFVRLARQWFSYFCIDERGITNKIFFCKNKDIFIAWDDFSDITIKSIAHGKGLYSDYMYLCKMPVDEYFDQMRLHKYYRKLPFHKNSYGIGQDENLFSISYSKKLLDEVLKYVDKDRIKNLHKVVSGAE